MTPLLAESAPVLVATATATDGRGHIRGEAVVWLL